MFQCNNTWKYQNTKGSQGKRSSRTLIRLFHETITQKDNIWREPLQCLSVLDTKLQLKSKTNQATTAYLLQHSLHYTKWCIYVMCFFHKQRTLNKHLPFAMYPNKDLFYPKQSKKSKPSMKTVLTLEHSNPNTDHKIERTQVPGVWNLCSRLTGY